MSNENQTLNVVVTNENDNNNNVTNENENSNVNDVDVQVHVTMECCDSDEDQTPTVVEPVDEQDSVNPEVPEENPENEYDPNNDDDCKPHPYNPLNSSFERLYTNLVEIVGNGSINLRNIVSITAHLMILTNNYNLGKGMGFFKKELVIKVVTKYVKANVKDADERRELLLFISLTLPPMIDVVASVDTGLVKLKIKGCFNKICCGICGTGSVNEGEQLRPDLLQNPNLPPITE